MALKNIKGPQELQMSTVRLYEPYRSSLSISKLKALMSLRGALMNRVELISTFLFFSVAKFISYFLSYIINSWFNKLPKKIYIKFIEFIQPLL